MKVYLRKSEAELLKVLLSYDRRTLPPKSRGVVDRIIKRIYKANAKRVRK